MIDEKTNMTPAYVSYKSFSNLINELREDQMPPVIDSSVVQGSNSAKSTMIGSLKALGLIDKENRPAEKFVQLVRRPEEYEANLKLILETSYPFLFDADIDLSNTTTELVAGKFSDAGASGSTVAKGMSFFLAAAKDAKITVSSRVKAKQPSRKPKRPNQKKTSSNENPAQKPVGNVDSAEPPRGTERISFTLRGMPDVTVYFPKDLSQDEARKVIQATIFNLKMYYDIEGEDL
jgi:hypothetical protein